MALPWRRHSRTNGGDVRSASGITGRRDDQDGERGHRTVTVLRNSGNIITIPLAVRTARSLDLATAAYPLAQPGEPERRADHKRGAE